MFFLLSILGQIHIISMLFASDTCCSHFKALIWKVPLAHLMNRQDVPYAGGHDNLLVRKREIISEWEADRNIGWRDHWMCKFWTSELPQRSGSSWVLIRCPRHTFPSTTVYLFWSSTESQNVLGWKDLWGSPGIGSSAPSRAHLKVKSGCLGKTRFEYVQGWRLHDLSGPLFHIWQASLWKLIFISIIYNKWWTVAKRKEKKLTKQARLQFAQEERSMEMIGKSMEIISLHSRKLMK